MKSKLKDFKEIIIDRSDIEEIFPELAESEDEKIRKWIIENIQETLDVDGFFEGQKTMAKDAIAWLEKQGEQKPFDYENANIQQKDFAPKAEPKFHIGDRIVEKDLNEYDYGTIKDIKYGKYFFKDGTYIDIQEQDLWQLVKEPSIEPKFKVGDKIISTISNIPYYITEVCNGYYLTDVGCIIMFNAQDNFKLSKQKPAWSQEDEKTLNTTISFLSEYAAKGYENAVMCIDWLKSLKQRIGE